jgi:molybdenum cofactor cytidylyltransferase
MTHASAAILILAAGQSRRMRGADKMLEDIDGQPLIRRQAEVALAAGLPVWVALPPDRPLRRAALRGLAVTLVEVPDAAKGLSFSIKAGNAAVPADMAMILWLADLPEITREDLGRLARAAQVAPTAIIRATTAAGRPGHPIVFPPALRTELAALKGDYGARDVLKQYSAATVFVPLPANRALTDLDTPEDWAAWRLRQSH